MKVNIRQFLDDAGIEDPLYPGKRLVQKCKQTGEFKSHCVVLDWRAPDRLHMEIKAGLSGKQLEPKDLKHYPVCFQSPTYIDIAVPNDNKGQKDDEDDDEEDEESLQQFHGSGFFPIAARLQAFFGRIGVRSVPRGGPNRVGSPAQPCLVRHSRRSKSEKAAPFPEPPIRIEMRVRKGEEKLVGRQASVGPPSPGMGMGRTGRAPAQSTGSGTSLSSLLMTSSQVMRLPL